MEPGQPSRTAQFVAYLRALGDLSPQVPGFSDPAAGSLLPPSWSQRLERTRLATKPPRSPLPFGYRGLGLFQQFRTVVLDRALGAALPFEQLVILGAGLDSRAWRLPGLASVRVFEVDHPATQAWKRARCKVLSPLAKEVRFVPVDFTREEPGMRLAAAGHDPGQSTFWLWEGVAMYLDAAQVIRILATMARRSAPGSRMAMTYLTKRGGRMPSSFLLAVIGEPVRSAFTQAELAEAANQAGWSTTSDSGLQDWQRELAPGLSLAGSSPWLQWHERIWIGRI